MGPHRLISMLRTLIFILLPVVLIGLIVIAPFFDAARSRSEKERAVTIRMTIFTWLLGAVLVLGFVLVPNKQRVLMLVPAFFISVVVGKVWKAARRRIRRDRDQPDIDRMKRIN